MTEASSPDYETIYGAVFRFVYRMIGHWEDAQDLTQEAFSRLAAHPEPITGADGTRRWLFVVARNLALGELRSRTRQRSTRHGSNDHETPSPSEIETANEMAQFVQRAIAALPDQFREVVLLREYESMTYEEIAAVTGTAVGTVRSRLARARGMLRNALACVIEDVR